MVPPVGATVQAISPPVAAAPGPSPSPVTAAGGSTGAANINVGAVVGIAMSGLVAAVLAGALLLTVIKRRANRRWVKVGG